MTNVFIVGSKGIPARYGGFETFVENLTKRKVSDQIHYFVTSIGGNGITEYNGATCVSIPIKKDTSFNRILNVSKALSWVESYIRNDNSNSSNIVYILGCRVGLLLRKHYKRLHKLGCKVVANPDGLEWKRGKWNKFQKKVLLLSEKKLINNSDKLICDSLGIKEYIVNKYKKIDTNDISFIAYGCDLAKSKTGNKELEDWLDKFGVTPNNYFLMIGRFVPENNFELVIREFMKSKTQKKLLVISNVTNDSFYQLLESKLHFSIDKRIVFAGTCYNEELVKKIREDAFAYIHGHSVGGTNPSLLEALGSTKINLLYDISFNREVGGNECLYFNSSDSNLSNLIDYVAKNYERITKDLKPASIIENRYQWCDIVKQYENYFLKLGGN